MTGDLWTAPARGRDAVRARRGRALPAASTGCRRGWPRSGTAMRLNHDDESVVVVPSITLDRARRRRSGTMTQAYEERFLFLLLLLRQPRLRMVYVTSHADRARDRRVLPRAAARRDPQPRPGPALAWSRSTTPRPRSLSEKLLDRPRLLRADRATLIPNRARSHLVPVQHHRARARRRAQPRHPDVRRRPAAAPTSAPRPAAAGCSPRSGVPHPLGAEDLHTLDDLGRRAVGDAGAAAGDGRAPSSSSTRASPGAGNALVDLTGLPAPGVARRARRRSRERLRRHGAGVRERRRSTSTSPSSPRAAASSRSGSPGTELRSPSVQLRVAARRRGRAAVDPRPAARRRRAGRATSAACSRPPRSTPG